MKLTIGFVFCIVAAAILATPNTTRRGVLFGFAVPPDFRRSVEGRRSVAEFRVLVVLALIVALGAIFFAPPRFLAPVSVVGPLLILCIGAVGFARERRRVAPVAVEPLHQREADLSNVPDQLPWFVWLAPGAFVILLLAAAFLHVNWNRIPVLFPVHWGIDGQPDRWNHRNFQGVYGPLLFGTELCGWMLIMGLATWFGARRSRFRHVTLAASIGFEYMLALLFTAIAVASFVHVPIWLFVLGPLVLVVPSVIAVARALAEPSETVEPTPNECWKAGMIYFNPNDAALFVEKRAGLGYTLNFGNRWSWVLALGLVLIVGTAPLLM